MLAQLLKCPPSPLWRLKRSLEQPGDSQRRLLHSLVQRAKNTVWGRIHAFGKLRRSPRLIEEYQCRVPLSEFADLQPYLDRVVNGEPDVVWPGFPTACAVSGGTCSGGRIIPLFPETIAFLTRSSLLPGLCYLASKPEASTILKGKILSLPGGVEDVATGGKMAGEVSGLLVHHAPRLLSHWLQALPRRVMLMEDWETKLCESARIAVRLDIRSIAMVPSWAPIFFERVREAIGTTTGAEAIKRAWPNLKVFFSGGVALASYRAILESYLGSGVDFIESYSASEGLFAFQDCSEEEGLLVNLNGGVLFEFVPVGEINSENPIRCTIETVELGVNYALYVTNTGGLWSLSVGDIVQFVSTRPPRLRVIGRLGEVLDRYGDATNVDHVRRVIRAADQAHVTKCLSHHLTYADSTDSPIPRHHWLLEFDVAPRDIESYARSLDESMKQINGRYRTRRGPGAMAGPVATTVPFGSCAAYLAHVRKRLSGQSKIVCISEDGGIARGILVAAREIDASRIVTVSIDQ